MRISIVTDEVSADPESAIELGVGWGIRDFELRGYYTDRAPLLSAYQRSHLRAVLDDFGARIVAVSPGLFKFPLPPSSPPRASLGWMDRAGFEAWDAARTMIRRHLDELLPAACDYANELGAGLIVSFSFARPAEDPGGGSTPAEVVDTFGRASERVAASGLGLVIETEAGFYGDDGPNTAALVRAVDHPALGVNWDPGNVEAGRAEAYPAGYAAVRDLVRHVHYKDIRWTGASTPDYVVEGEIDWRGQIRALADDGYDGYISIEPHMQPKIASAHASLERLRSLIAATESQPQAEEVRR